MMALRRYMLILNPSIEVFTYPRVRQRFLFNRPAVFCKEYLDSDETANRYRRAR